MDPLVATAADAAFLPNWLFEFLGWVPAIVFPTACGIQLLTILRTKSAAGVSIPAWLLFAFANISLFVYTEKYGEFESLLSTVGTAVLNLCIVVAAIRYGKRETPKAA
ncbi:MAG: hypothetical protein ACKO3W_05245 [bacterium]